MLAEQGEHPVGVGAERAQVAQAVAGLDLAAAGVVEGRPEREVDALTARKDVLGSPSAIIRGSVAAISVGLLNDVELLDLDYSEDKEAEVDLNLVMTGTGQFVEVQGSGEEATFSRSQLDRLLKLGKVGIDAVSRSQRRALGAGWRLDEKRA